MSHVTPGGPSDAALAAGAPTRLRSSWTRAFFSPFFFFLELVLRGYFELQDGGSGRSLQRLVAASG